MKIPAHFLFLAVALSLYGLINTYIGRRGWQAFSGHPIIARLFLGMFLFLALAYPIGRFAESLSRNWVTESLVGLGSFYLGAMLYLLLFVLLIDLFRLIHAFFPFFPKAVVQNPQKAGFFTAIFVLLAVMGVVAGGFINAISPKVKALSLRIEKDATGFKNLTIAVASDLHIGIMTRNGHLGKIVNLVKSCDPDLIFLVGDIVDEDMPPLKENQVLRMLQGLRAPLGVFAVTGNHEYYSGLAKNLALLQKAGVTVLRDEAVKVGESFFVIGRKDPTGTHVGVGRKPLAEITAALDRRRPLLLLDHQPVRLAEAEENGIDLQLSGHTHAGQLFPLDLINKKVWELNWGYLRKGQTQYYVSCGVGTWGPPLRTGSVPEIVKIELEFRKP